jgi:glutamate/tyrosine decarboxylase-like PLP-dependent enzyme
MPECAAVDLPLDLPSVGTPLPELLERMRGRKAADADWRAGRTFSLIYPAGEDVDQLLAEASALYVHDNALNPLRFPSLRAMEAEVVKITAGLLHGGERCGGCMTSGGTESILMAVKTARNRARAERSVTRPELLAPYSAHPAFAKAADLLGLELVQAPLGPDYRVDVDRVADLIGERTALVVGSAPNYPFGVVDPIPELAALALERGISFHTDACLGGFLFPFYERLGEAVPPFDFRVPGVSTLSADVHKYGYATKGASVIAHRDRESLRRYQRFAFDRWPGGSYASNALAGARSGAPIAAAWAVLHFLGERGYLERARMVRDTFRKIRAGIEAIPGLRVLGDPRMSLLAFAADGFDVMAVGDAMDARGWCLDRQRDPDALHLMISPLHARVADAFLLDLREAAARPGPARGASARYG